MSSMCSEAREWQMHGTETLLQTPFFRLEVADVELPDGQRLDHYLFRLPPVVLTAMLDEQDGVLLVWRYRFIPGSWGWELPSGLADPAEDLSAAAAREAFKETGWQADRPQPLISLEASAGLTDSVHHVFWTSAAEQRGQPGYETVRMEWIRLPEVPALIRSGEIRAASTAAALVLLAEPARGQAAKSIRIT
jgi:8-oxo-dGTP pyrophosphatase MutT (NUDIX family)